MGYFIVGTLITFFIFFIIYTAFIVDFDFEFIAIFISVILVLVSIPVTIFSICHVVAKNQHPNQTYECVEYGTRKVIRKKPFVLYSTFNVDEEEYCVNWDWVENE